MGTFTSTLSGTLSMAVILWECKKGDWLVVSARGASGLQELCSEPCLWVTTEQTSELCLLHNLSFSWGGGQPLGNQVIFKNSLIIWRGTLGAGSGPFIVLCATFRWKYCISLPKKYVHDRLCWKFLKDYHSVLFMYFPQRFAHWRLQVMLLNWIVKLLALVKFCSLFLLLFILLAKFYFHRLKYNNKLGWHIKLLVLEN